MIMARKIQELHRGVSGTVAISCSDSGQRGTRAKVGSRGQSCHSLNREA